MIWSYWSLYDDRIDVILLNITLRKKQMDNDEKEKQKQLLFIQEDSVKTVTFPCLVYRVICNQAAEQTEWPRDMGFQVCCVEGDYFWKVPKCL